MQRKKVLLAILSAFSLTISSCKNETQEETIDEITDDQEEKREEEFINTSEKLGITLIINGCNTIINLVENVEL